MKESLRMSRVNELIKREVAGLLEKTIERHPGTLASITEVHTTPDLKHARVYVSILGSVEQRRSHFKKIEKQRALIQSTIGSHTKLKYTPVLNFILDNRTEGASRVISIIDKLEKNEK